MHFYLFARSLSKIVAVFAAVFALSACEQPVSSGESGSASLTDVKSSVAEAIAVTDEPVRTVTVGSIGGAIRLSEQTGAIYSIALRDGGAWLEGVAVLHGAQRGWYNEGADDVPLALKNVGVGGSLGKHTAVVTPDGKGLWIDDNLYLPLEENNVVLLEGAGDTMVKVSDTTFEAYLGPAPLKQAKQRKALVQERLRALLTASPAIRSQWPGGGV